MKRITFFVTVLMLQFAVAQNFPKTDSIGEVNLLGRKKINEEMREFARHAQSTEVLSEYELNRNTGNFIEQSLGTLAGVQVDKRTTAGGQRVVVRGYGNDQKFNSWGVKMYLNNVPLTNADGVTILEDVDFALINRIDVVKGPASTLYGGGVGGTVRFYIKPETNLGTSVTQKFLGGSFGTFQSATRADHVTENSALMFNYNHFSSDGYRPHGNSNRNNYTFLGNFRLSASQQLEVYAAHNNSYEGVPGQISYKDYYSGTDNGNLAYIRRNAGNRFISTRFSVGHKWQIMEGLSNQTNLFYGHLEVNRKAAGAFENTMSPTYGFRTAFSFEKGLSNEFKNSVEFGSEYSVTKALTSNYRYTGTNPDIPDEVRPINKNSYFRYDNSAVSVFVVNRLTYIPRKLSLLAGLSHNSLGYDRSDLLALPGMIDNYKDLTFSKKFKPSYSPHIALQKVLGLHTVNLSYSEGFNAPTASTAAITGTNPVTANDNLRTEHAKMWDLSAQGMLVNTKFDYQVSLFSMDISNKLTQLSAGTYTYWANTGRQQNKGLEASLGFAENLEGGFLKRFEAYFNTSFYDFRYRDFKTLVGSQIQDFSGKTVVGIPKTKLSVGADIDSRIGVYLYNTFNYLGAVYADFGNSNRVKGFHQLNSKLGYKKTFGKFELDTFVLVNNLTNQINYTFLFLGNNAGDNDPDSQYPANIATDVTPGPKRAYFFTGLSAKYRF